MHYFETLFLFSEIYLFVNQKQIQVKLKLNFFFFIIGWDNFHLKMNTLKITFLAALPANNNVPPYAFFFFFC